MNGKKSLREILADGELRKKLPVSEAILTLECTLGADDVEANTAVHRLALEIEALKRDVEYNERWHFEFQARSNRWEGKFHAVRRENNKLRAACYKRQKASTVRDGARSSSYMPDIVSKLAGTNYTGAEMADKHGIGLDEVEAIMGSAGYERCPDCDTWVECCELVDDENAPVSCPSCREGS